MQHKMLSMKLFYAAGMQALTDSLVVGQTFSPPLLLVLNLKVHA